MRISQREKMLLGVGSAVLLAAFLYVGVIHPAWRQLERLDTRIRRRTEILRQLQALRKDWNRLEAERMEILRKIRKRGPDFSMFRHLEELARQEGVDSRIQYMRPLSGTGVAPAGGLVRKGLEVKLKQVDLVRLIRYLYRIEYSEKLLMVESIHIKPLFTDPDRINVTFRVYTLAKG